jgi:RNA polymerase sigma factor (sigma-70 family)
VTDIAAGSATLLEATVHAAASGDEGAFARLVAEHHASMSRVAFVILGDEEATRDAVQSAWTFAWRRIGTLREPGSIRPWLVAIAANEARKASRRMRRTALVGFPLVVERMAEREGFADPIDALEVADLQLVLRGLNAEDRGLLAMRYAAGLDSNEIAAQLGMSASGVRSRLARLLERMREDLAVPMELER